MYKLFAFILSCCFLTTIAFAQSADEKTVTETMENLRKAMLSADTNTLYLLTAKPLTYGHSSGLVENQKEFVDEFVTGKTIFTTLNFANQTIGFSGDIAMVRNHLTADTNNNHVAGKVDLWALWIWQKQGDAWKLIARQGYRIPQEVK
jgi:ketosteroid isomerase-like protein